MAKRRTSNFTFHEYFGVDSKIVWQIIQTELPGLTVRMEQIREELVSSSN